MTQDETRASDEGTRWYCWHDESEDPVGWAVSKGQQGDSIDFWLADEQEQIDLRGTLNALEAELSALRAENEHLAAERDEAYFKGVAAVTSIRCTEHQARPQLNETASGSECAVCALRESEDGVQRREQAASQILSEANLDIEQSHYEREQLRRERNDAIQALALANADAEAAWQLATGAQPQIEEQQLAAPIGWTFWDQWLHEYGLRLIAHRARLAPAGDAEQPQAGGA